MNYQLATLAQIMAAVEADELSSEDAVTELTRRIDKRAAAGKYPMEHVVAAREMLMDAEAV